MRKRFRKPDRRLKVCLSFTPEESPRVLALGAVESAEWAGNEATLSAALSRVILRAADAAAPDTAATVTAKANGARVAGAAFARVLGGAS